MIAPAVQERPRSTAEVIFRSLFWLLTRLPLAFCAICVLTHIVDVLKLSRFAIGRKESTSLLDYSPLNSAIVFGDLAGAKEILLNSNMTVVDLNRLVDFSEDGAESKTLLSPLAMAALVGNSEVVRVLLKAGADSKAGDFTLAQSDGRPPVSSSLLGLALSSQFVNLNPDVSGTIALLEAGADPNGSGFQTLTSGLRLSFSPLGASIATKFGLQKTKKDNNEQAISVEGTREIALDIENMSVLLSWGADPNKAALKSGPLGAYFTVSPLGLAIITKNAAAVELLLKSGADPNRPCATIGPMGSLASVSCVFMAVASDRGDLETAMLSALLNAGANPEHKASLLNLGLTVGLDFSPLSFAAQTHQYEAVSLLLNKGADPNKSGFRLGPFGVLLSASPLFSTTVEKTCPTTEEITSLLIDNGAAIDDTSLNFLFGFAMAQSPLYLAAARGDADTVAFLTRKGANPSKQGFYIGPLGALYSDTPLSVSASHGYVKTEAELRRAGADSSRGLGIGPFLFSVPKYPWLALFANENGT